MGSTSSEKRPKRRWLQFSVRTVLLLVAVLCVWLGYRVHASRQRAEAIAHIEKLGGQIYYDYQVKLDSDGDPYLVPLTPYPYPEWAKPLTEVLFPPRVWSVGLHSIPLSDDDIPFIAGFDGLHTAVLAGTGITDAGLAELSRLSELRNLTLQRTNVTDEGVASVARMRNLRQLDLSETAVTDKGLAKLKGLQLRELFLWRLNITDAGVAHLREMKSLERLILDETRVTDAALADIAHLNNLQHWLGLCYTQITDEGLEQLSGLKKLEHINLLYTDISREAALKLKQQLPNTEISHDYGPL